MSTVTRSRTWLALGTLLLAACSATPEKVNIRYKSNFLDQQSKVATEPPVAATDLRSVLQQGDTSRKLGKDDEALYYYVKALDLDAANAHALVRIGDIHREKANDDLAEVAYRLALKAAPKNVDALEGLGLIQLRQRAYQEAKQSFTNAVALDRRRWRSHNGLGLIADLNGQHRAAMGHFQQALHEHPDDPQLLNNIGYSNYLSGNWAEALTSLDAALQIDPRHEPAWLNKGLILARQGHEKAALGAFRTVLNEADAYNNLGYIYMQEGKTDAAEELFERAISASPSYHELANENLRRLRMSTE